MHLVVRQASRDDFETAIRYCPYKEFPPARKREAWETIWDEGSAFGVVVSDLAARPKEQDVALLVCTYVQDEVVDALRTNDRPFALRKIVELHRANAKPFLAPQQIAEKNARSGLNLFIAFYGWHGDDSQEEPAPNLRAFVGSAFTERHGGNRHVRVLCEARGPAYATLASRMGFEVLNDYRGWSGGSATVDRPFLLGVSREEALRNENPWLVRLFTYYPPRFHFTDHQREILLLAREGYTDNEIAEVVGAKADAIKKRWSGIYERVNEILPGMLPRNGQKGRGAEKRRALLSHLRDRPEELRPYVRRAAQPARR